MSKYERQCLVLGFGDAHFTSDEHDLKSFFLGNDGDLHREMKSAGKR